MQAPLVQRASFRGLVHESLSGEKPLFKKASHASSFGSKGLVSKAPVSMKAFHLRSPLSKPPSHKTSHLRSPCPSPLAQNPFPSAGPVKSAQFAFGRSRRRSYAQSNREKKDRASGLNRLKPDTPGRRREVIPACGFPTGTDARGLPPPCCTSLVLLPVRPDSARRLCPVGLELPMPGPA